MRFLIFTAINVICYVLGGGLLLLGFWGGIVYVTMLDCLNEIDGGGCKW